jgi:hypothetical protein
LLTTDGFFALVEKGSGIEGGCDILKHLFHLPEFFVLQGYLPGRPGGIGAQHPFAVDRASSSTFFVSMDMLSDSTFRYP